MFEYLRRAPRAIRTSRPDDASTPPWIRLRGGGDCVLQLFQVRIHGPSDWLDLVE